MEYVKHGQNVSHLKCLIFSSELKLNSVLSHDDEISQYAVRAIKKLNQLYCKRHKRFKRTTNSDHNRPVYNNLLKQQFSMSAPDLAWVSDITYIWTSEGWLYLSALRIFIQNRFWL